MTLSVLRAPVGAGKTEQVQRTLLDVKARDPLARIWVLTATTRQEIAFRQRMMSRDGVHILFNVEFFSFPTLYRRLLAMAGNPQRALDDSARFALLRVVIDSVRDQMMYFRPIADTPGFARILAEFLYELKQNMITPEAFAAAASTAKERELALLYAAYQRTLIADDIVDREGEGWLALEAAQQPELCRDVALLVADGYDQFNALQARLLVTLGAQIPDTIVTLTTAPGRDHTVGRRFQAALEQLQRAAGMTLPEIPVAHLHDGRPAVLQVLTERVFVSGAPAFTDPCDELTLFGAPDEARETAMVLRRVKRLLHAGARPDDIVIAVRDWTRYGDLLAEQGRSYGLPLAIHYGLPLADNPAVRTLRSALELAAGDFRRRELLDLLRSPYVDLTSFGLTQEVIDLIDACSRAEIITGGRSAWLDALAQWERSASRWHAEQAAEPDEDRQPPPAAAYTAEQIAAACAALDAVFELLTPPPSETLEAYIHWIEQLITPDSDAPDAESVAAARTGLHLPDRIRTISDHPGDHLLRGVIERDLAALETFMRTLRGLLGAERLIMALRPADPTRRLAWRDFLRLLLSAVEGVSISRAPGRDGRVLVTSVSDARGLPHAHVFILGLSEGIFPAPVPEDPLLLDSERAALRRAGLPLSLQSERADDDGLFYELLSLAGRSITLSRPMVRDGTPIPESHLWRSCLRVVPNATSKIQRADQVVTADDVCTSAEAVLALSDGLSRGTPPDYYGWLSRDDAWQRLAHARTVEARRMSSEASDHYAGLVRDPSLRTTIAAQFTPQRRWSASQLNDMAVCGYNFFARRLLKLEPVRELQEGMDVLQLGTLQHAILERTYRRVRDEIGAISPQDTERALAILEAEANAVFAQAPALLGFRPSALWEKERAEILRRLRSLVETDFSGDALPTPRTIVDVEVPFDTRWKTLRLGGLIDRVDRHGDALYIIDYKSSRSGGDTYRRAAVTKGRNVQLLIYLLAAEDRYKSPVTGHFWHLGDAKLSDSLARDEDGEPAIEAGLRHIDRYLEAAQRADFTSQPARLQDGKCTSYCEFSHLCRISVTGRSKRAGAL